MVYEFNNESILLTAEYQEFAIIVLLIVFLCLIFLLLILARLHDDIHSIGLDIYQNIKFMKDNAAFFKIL